MFAKEALEEFRVECELRRLTRATIKGYYNNTRSFLLYTEKYDGVELLDEISSVHIKRYMRYLIEKNLTESYINGILKCLRAFFKYVSAEGYIVQNPAAKVHKFKRLDE